MKSFMSGMIVAGYLVVSLYFFKFWRKVSDVFFLYFALAFLILAGQRTALAFAPGENEHDAAIYLLRLAAFLVILFAIIDKNRRAAR
jgi:hypothetical protein